MEPFTTLASIASSYSEFSHALAFSLLKKTNLVGRDLILGGTTPKSNLWLPLQSLRSGGGKKVGKGIIGQIFGVRNVSFTVRHLSK
jgi:hypothetical protein